MALSNNFPICQGKNANRSTACGPPDDVSLGFSVAMTTQAAASHDTFSWKLLSVSQSFRRNKQTRQLSIDVWISNRGFQRRLRMIHKPSRDWFLSFLYTYIRVLKFPNLLSLTRCSEESLEISLMLFHEPFFDGKEIRLIKNSFHKTVCTRESFDQDLRRSFREAHKISRSYWANTTF